MKIICTQENLKKGLGIVLQTVKKTAALPILSNVLISTEAGRIKFSTTNLEMGTTCFIRGKIETEGKTTIPANLIYSYINNLPPAKVLLELENDALKLECESFKAQIKSLSPSEFPLIPKIEGQAICKIDAEKLKKALSSVVFAAASDETRPEIAGIFLKFEEDKIFLAATDGFRLAEKTIALAQKPAKIAGFIIPHQTASELLRILLKSDEGLVEIFSKENQIKFKINDIEFVSRLVDGQYPDYQKIIPDRFSTKIKLSAMEFSNAIQQASLFSKIDSNEVEIAVLPKSGEIKIQAESGQAGSNKAVLRGEGEGKEEKIIFNYQYVLDGLGALDGDFVNLLMSGDIGPAALRPEGSNDYIYIIMPIKK